MVFETLKVSKEGAAVFVEIVAPPMNLLGPELVRDLVSLIQLGGRGRQGARVQERRRRSRVLRTVAGRPAVSGSVSGKTSNSR